MKKKLLLAVSCLFYCSSIIVAQDLETDKTMNEDQDSETLYESERYQKVWKSRKKYFNFNYSQQKLKVDEYEGEIKSKWGAGISTGRTYYLHKRPILGMIKFGLDWTYLDLNVGNYSINDNGYDDTDMTYDPEYDESYDLYKMEAGMQFGPSVTINPTGRLKIAAYFHVVPSYSAFYADDEFDGNYATYFTYGASLSYGFISVGAEQRWGNTKITDDEEALEIKYKNKGPRFYLSFRF